MSAYLDFDEVECINKALKRCQNQTQENATQRDLDKLIKMFPVGEQYFFNSGKPFENFAPKYKKLLKEALVDYCKLTQPDLPIAIKILQYLT